MAQEIERVWFEIERNLSLEGYISSIPWLHCDVTVPVNIEGRTDNYAILSQGTRFGFTELGYIDPLTREFLKFKTQKNRRGNPIDVTFFESTQPGVCGNKTKMYVPILQIPYLKTLEEVLSITGITIKK